MITDPDALRVLCFGDSNTYAVTRRVPGVEGTVTPDPAYVRLNPDPQHAVRSRQLAEALQRTARERGVPYVAAAEVAQPGDGGVHLDMASHARLGELLAGTIRRTCHDRRAPDSQLVAMRPTADEEVRSRERAQ